MAKARLEELGTALNSQVQVSENKFELTSADKDADTRQDVAKKFVRYYFLLLTIIIVGIPFYNAVMYALVHTNDLSISLKDSILTYSAVVGPTVGLVVAYYFKSKQD